MAGIYNADGYIVYTLVDGTSWTGIHNPNGTYNAVDRTDETDYVGLYHPCGAYNVRISTSSTSRRYDGAIVVVSLGNGLVGQQQQVEHIVDPEPRPFDDFVGLHYEDYSTIRLYTDYTGPCMDVRRGSDNATRTLDFVDNVVDVGPDFLAWAGSDSVYVTKWYGQNSNGHDVVQASTSSQPRIVIAGSLQKGPNGYPVIVFDGVDDYLDVQSSTGFTVSRPAVTMACIAAPTALTGVQTFVSTLTTALNSRAVLVRDGVAVRVAGRRLDADSYTQVAGDVPPVVDTWARHIGRLRPDAAAADVTTNGSFRSAGWHGPGSFAATAQPANVTLGGSPTLAGYMSGKVSAFVLAQSALDIAALDAALLEIMP